MTTINDIKEFIYYRFLEKNVYMLELLNIINSRPKIDQKGSYNTVSTGNGGV